MVDGLGMLSGSDEDDDPGLSADDDGPLPVAQPLAALGRALPPAAAPAAAPAPLPEPDDAAPAPATTTQTANGCGATLSDDSDDEHQLTTPASMPRHAPLTEPVHRDAEPYDAAEAAEQARSDATASNGAPWTSTRTDDGGGGDPTSAEASTDVERVVDPALASMWIVIKGEKNDSVAQVPMDACLHGRTKNADGKTWPPYDITLPEARETQSQRTAWLHEHLKADEERLLTTILFFDVGPVGEPHGNRIMALLLGRLVNPDANPDVAKRIVEYNECIAGAQSEHDSEDAVPKEWFLGIPVPLPFVRHLYKLPNNGLPTIYDPNINDAVKFVLVSKLEEQCTRDARWRLIVDKSRDGANSGASRGRQAVVGASRKRHKAAAPVATAATTLAPVPAAAPMPTVAADAATAAEPPAPAPPIARPLDPFPLATRPEDAAPCAFSPTDLSWRSLSPEWMAVVIPKIPRGFVVELSPPTHRCAGMISFKQSPDDPDDL